MTHEEKLILDRLQVDRIKRLEEALQRQDNAIIDKDAQIEQLKALITRAADALASGPREPWLEWDAWHARTALIAELRKAAE